MPDILPSIQADQGYIEAYPVVLVDQTGAAMTSLAGAGPSTGTVTSITSAAATTTLSGPNAARKGLTVTNESTANLYVKLGTAASLTSYTVKLVPNAYWEMPFNFTGPVTGIWDAANGFARVTTLA